MLMYEFDKVFYVFIGCHEVVVFSQPHERIEHQAKIAQGHHQTTYGQLPRTDLQGSALARIDSISKSSGLFRFTSHLKEVVRGQSE